MTGRRGLAAVALAGLLLATLTGCPVGGDRTPDDRRADPTTAAPPTRPAPALPTRATTDLPPYSGPPPGAPGTAGPVTRLRAAVDLTPATPGVFAVPEAAAAAPDGRSLVLLAPVDHSSPRLATVGSGAAVTASVPVPRFAEVAGMHVLADGAVAVAGQFGSDDEGGRGDVGVAVVDPRTGATRTAVAVPLGVGVFTLCRSALAADGRTVYVFVTSVGSRAVPEEVVAVDTGTGSVTARRDLTDDLAALSAFPAGFQAAGLLPRPGGGVTLAFDATPVSTSLARIPTLLRFDAGLRPGPAVRLTDLAEAAATRTVTVTPDGTVFAVVEVRDGVWVLAVPDGGGAGPVLAQLDDDAHDYALVVEPAQEWALLPALTGARAVDLRTGAQRGPLDLGCRSGLHVRGLLPGAAGAALLYGECGTPAQRTAMLWVTGP